MSGANGARGAVFRRMSANKKLSPVEKAPYENPNSSRWTNSKSPFRFRPTPRAPFCASTSVSISATCSDAECPFKKRPDGTPGGCFIEAEFFTKRAMVELDASAAGMAARAVIAEEVAAIDAVWNRRPGVPQDGARGGRDLRIHVAGDTPDELSARMLAGAAARWIARGGGRPWTYTHSWRRIRPEAFSPISVLASCETPGDVDAALRRRYVPALVVDQFPNGKRPFRVSGVNFIPCPAETLGKTCVECRLCLDADLKRMGAGIAFQVHGHDADAARRALVPLGRAA